MALQVIGLGIPRTGTTSLKVALETLGYSKCYHMTELVKDIDRLPLWKKLYKEGNTNWDELFEGYQAAVDYPMTHFYPKILEQYPEAKVLMSVRDPESWYESVLQTIYQMVPQTMGQKFNFMMRMLRYPAVRRVAPLFKFLDEIFWRGLFDGRFEDKAFAIDQYHAHMAAVQEAVPKDKLLILNLKEGWEPLCNFLEQPIPDVPFPIKNTRKEMQEDMDSILTGGNM